MTSPEQTDKLPTAAPAEHARLQAKSYDSIFANVDLELEGGGTISVPPHPDMGMLDDDTVDAYNELLFERDTQYEREVDILIPEQERNGVLMPAETVRGDLKVPYRWKSKGVDSQGNAHAAGQLLKPAWSIRVVQVVLGETEYKRLRDGGRNAADVWKIWQKRGLEVRDRQFQGSPSDGSSVVVAPVSESDSQ